MTNCDRGDKNCKRGDKITKGKIKKVPEFGPQTRKNIKNIKYLCIFFCRGLYLHEKEINNKKNNGIREGLKK